MLISRFAAITLSALFIAGCASGPRPQAPIPQNLNKAEFVLSHTATLDVTSNTQKHLNVEKDIVYHQEFGGGGAGVGLLLGPFGVAANVAMIDSNTQKDVDQMLNKISVKPRDLFVAAANSKGVSASIEAAEGRLRVTPYIYVSKTEEKKLLVAAAIIIEQTATAEKWTGKYMYELPVTYTVENLSSLDPVATESLRSALTNGYTNLLAVVAKETNDRLVDEKSVTFKSNLLSPRQDIAMAGHIVGSDNDVTWVRTYGGVYALRKESFSPVQ